jgi:hypothetical protein
VFEPNLPGETDPIGITTRFLLCYYYYYFYFYGSVQLLKTTQQQQQRKTTRQTVNIGYHNRYLLPNKMTQEVAIFYSIRYPTLVGGEVYT